MQWEDIPSRAGMTTPHGGVSVAFRKASKVWRLHVTVGVERVKLLGWQPKQQILVQRNLAAGALRLSPWMEERRLAGKTIVALRHVRGMALLVIEVSNVPQGKNRPAEVMPTAVEGAALVVTLPDWAAPERVGAEGARRAAEQARARLEAQVDPFRRYG